MPEKENNKTIKISLFPLSEIVLFPGMNLPLHIFEDKYIKMISECIKEKKEFGVVCSKNDVCSKVGTLAEITDVEKLEEGKMNILVEGKERFKIISFLNEKSYNEAIVELYIDTGTKIDFVVKDTLKEIRGLSLKALKMFDEVSEEEESSKKLKLPSNPNELLFLVSANLTCSYELKQAILETRSIKVRANEVLSLLKEEIQRLEVLVENKLTKKDVVKNGKLKI